MALRVSSPVLVGRGPELAVLLDALAAATTGGSRTVLVGGEAGIGKSRLVREFETDARAAGAIVLHGGCIRLGRDEGLPFAPLAEALRGLVRERGIADLRGLLDAATAELTSLVPELGRGGESLVVEQRPDWAQTRLFDAVLVLLGRLGAEGPAVFVAEDLHWADRSTRDLFAFLARNLGGEQVILIGTYRSDELHRRHPLREWIGEMDRLGVERITLERLDQPAMQEQITAITGSQPSAESLASVAARSGGNPFFVEELLAASGEGHLPASLRDLLLARVGTLSDEAQRILGVAAVSGPLVDHDVLLMVAGLDDEGASAPLREATATHLVLPTSAGEQSAYSFRHALLQEAIYDDLLPRDRRRIHAEYARVLAAVQPPSGAAGASHLAALAHHAEAAHQLPEALTAWVRAARAAYRVHAIAEAAHAYDRCLELWDAVTDEDRPRDADLVDLLYEASFALNGAGELSRSRAMADRAVQLEGGRDPERAALLLERLGRTEWLDGDLLSATATLERAVELIADAPASAASARVVGGLAAVLMLRGRSRRAVSEGNRALQLARAAASKDAEAFVLNTLGASLADLGRCSEAMEHGRAGMHLAIELDRADEVHRAYANLSTALELCGRADEAIAMALEGVEWANRNRYRLQGAFLEGNAAQILFQHGRWAEAERLLHGDDRGDVGGVATINKALTAGPLAIHTGRLDDARRVLRDARDRVARLRDAQFTGPIMVALVELALIENRAIDAEALVEEALDLMTETEDVRHRAELMGLAVRAAFVRAAAATAARDHDGAEGARRSADRWMDRLAAHVRAPESQTGLTQREAEACLAQAEAERTTAGPEPSGAAWEAAAAAWEAVDRPYAAAWCRYRQAEVLVTGNQRSAATAVLDEAHRAAMRIGATLLHEDIERLASLARLGLGAHDGVSQTVEDEEREAAQPEQQATAEASSRPYDLTDRELQILPFLAAGLTNRQIGQAMFISPSTAGVHVSRILSKMGVSSRVEAAALAVRAGIVE